jgi:peptidoglycan/xylan/chitin deacetylase (PgdA/CDA1 family)
LSIFAVFVCVFFLGIKAAASEPTAGASVETAPVNETENAPDTEALQTTTVAPMTATAPAPVSAPAPLADPRLSYAGHVQNIGWQSFTEANNGNFAGTTGRSLRLEALILRLYKGGYEGGISVETHVQNIGWQAAVSETTVIAENLFSGINSSDKIAGTTGKSLRVEAVKIKLTGEIGDKFDIFYRVHVENVGWTAWTSNGQAAGTEGISYRMEGIEIKLLPKGSANAPKTGNAFFAASKVGISYSAKPKGQDYKSASNGASAGTENSGIQIEEFKMSPIGALLSGNVEYSAHVQDIGWQGFKSASNAAGASGKRIEAIKIRLTGLIANYFDIYYRVYVPGWKGWTGWAKNGNPAGTQARSNRIEAIQVKLVTKGASFNAGTNQFTGIDASRPMVALTFDDGPSPYTAKILALLEKYGGRATFCQTGKCIPGYPSTETAIIAQGSEIIGHSMDHSQLTKLSREQIKYQLNGVNDRLKAVGVPASKLFRPPYGAMNSTVLSVAKELGMTPILWSVDTRDWESRNATAVFNMVKKYTRNGSIILCHDTHPTTLQAMEKVIPWLVSQGYQLVTVTELLTVDGKAIQAGKAYYSR